MVPENLLNPVLVKHVKEIEAAEKAQVKGQKEKAQEQGGQKAGEQQKQEPQQQTAVTDVTQSGTKRRKRLSAGGD